MIDFELKVKQFIHEHQLLSENNRVLVGVSGGPDSLALLLFLHKYRKDWGIEVSCASVDHMIRGSESFQEMEYVSRICQEMKIPFYGKQVNVPEEVNKRDDNTENIARKLRYQFFKEVMEKNNLDVLALAHHGDDQIETILMRLTRGTSIGGASGIKVDRPFGQGRLIRPFLCVTKEEIESYIKLAPYQPVYDPSNQMDLYTRNRYRKYVLPFLKKENSNVHLHFQRFSLELAEDDEFLMDLAKQRVKEILRHDKNGDISLDINVFKNTPIPLQRRAIHLILNYLYQENFPADLSGVHVYNILDMIGKTHPSGQLHLPNGLQVIRSYEILIFSFKEQKEKPYYYEWNKGESISLPNGDQLVMRSVDDKVENMESSYFYLDPNTSFPLIVRTRKAGDRIKLKGMNGSKKLKSIFIDNKIPLHKRNTWPVVTDNKGNILWIPLLRKSKFEASYEKSSILLQYIQNNHF